MKETDLSRYVTAVEKDFPTALAEIKSGVKRSHWMWYVFPQLLRPGLSDTSTFYAIKNMAEAEAYLQHPVLGKNLLEISEALVALQDDHANRIFGSPDDAKLKSCATLFAAIPGAPPLFNQILAKFFNGIPDWETVRLLGEQANGARVA